MKGLIMKRHDDPKCGVCATPQFERNNYFYGKQFTVRDLQQEQSYFNDKRNLVNRMVLGWGVVCGLEVSWDPKSRKVVVKPGMALDCCGREIIICEDKHLSFDKDDDDYCLRDDHRPEGKFVLCLEYDECRADPVDLAPANCDEKGRREYNRIRETYKLRLKPWDEACPKEPPKETKCPDYYKHDALQGGPYPPSNCQSPNVHDFLCGKLKHCPECEACDCVIIATITFPPKQGGGYQDPKYGGGHQDPVVDSCTNRKFVYNNTLLYDLINCYHGDLPHIVDFSWRKYAYPKREMNFDQFLQMINEGVTVYFDRDMVDASLNIHTFMITYLYRETGTGTYLRKQIPVESIRPGKVGNCYTATLHARKDWIKDELETPNSELRADTRYEPGVDVEITLRGSRIWSRYGKGLDGEYLADKLPTGNGTQGGDFIDWFRVKPTGEKPKGKSYEGQF
jgi:hypothetical protein